MTCTLHFSGQRQRQTGTSARDRPRGGVLTTFSRRHAMPRRRCHDWRESSWQLNPDIKATTTSCLAGNRYAAPDWPPDAAKTAHNTPQLCSLLPPGWTEGHKESQDGVVVYFLQFASRSPPLASISWLWWRQVLSPRAPPPPPIPPDPGGKATTVLGSPSASGLRSDHSRPLLSHLLLWDAWWMGFSRQRPQLRG